MTKIKPIVIVLTTYKRLHFLKRVVKNIYENTSYPHRFYVVNNDNTDADTIRYLQQAKAHGYIDDFVNNDSNAGLSSGFKKGFDFANSINGDFDFVVFTQDDLLAPKLRPCWLETLNHLANKYPDIGAICMRIERTPRRDIDEFKDLIYSDTACPAVFRISSKELIEKIGFTKRPHWESHQFSKKVKDLGLKLAMATKVYASHIGYVSNKGFAENVEYLTLAENKLNQHIDNPYSEIDKDTNMPIKINSQKDRVEQKKREDYYKYWGVDFRTRQTKRITEEQLELAKYCEKGIVLDIGCGNMKCHPNCIGVDIHHESKAEIKTDCRDLWMFKDGEVDSVVSSHTLEHMPDVIGVLKEWKRVLKVGGILAIAVPDGELKSKYIRYNGHKINLGLKTLREIFKYILKMKIIELKHVDKKRKNAIVAMIVGVKRDE